MTLLSIVPHNLDLTNLLDGWIEAERNGIEFPVPFDLAWKMAGYSTKANAKQSGLKALKKGKQFSSQTMKTSSGGRPSELIMISIDGFKHFCLMADTPEGIDIRNYFIEATRKWEIVRQIAPEIAQQAETIAMQLELERLKNRGRELEVEKTLSEERQLATRHWAATVAPRAIGDRVLGIKEIRTTEYTRTIVDQSGNVLNAGKTLNKGRLCQEFGFVSKSGKPDYKLINALIQEAIAARAIASPWREVTTLASLEFDALLLPKLKQYYEASPSKRQMWMGE